MASHVIMKKLLVTILLTSAICFCAINYEAGVEHSFIPSIRVRPAYTIGKMTNGNFYSEIIPIRVLWNPMPEWYYGMDYSLGFESPRGNFAVLGNHRGYAIRAKAQFKPLYWIKSIFPDLSIKDFAISYEKQISDYYDGSTLDVGRLSYESWEEISIGFDITI